MIWLAMAMAMEPAGPVLDRTTPPTVPPPEVLQIAEPEEYSLSEAATAHYMHVPGVRKVEIRVLPRHGRLALLGGPTIEGRAVGWLADSASEAHDASQLSELEDLHNLDVYSSIGLHGGELGVEVPKEDVGIGLGLLTEVLQSAAFPKAETKRWVFDQYQYFGVSGPSSLSRVASAALAFAWFDKDHAYGARPDVSTLAEVKHKALANHYRRWLAESPLDVVVVGDVAWADIEQPLKEMVAGLGKAGEPDPELEVPAPVGRMVAVDMPGQEQVGLRLRMAGPARSDDDRVAMWGANYVLGGHFLSRLNTNLREEKGWTYGSRSRYALGEHYGIVTVSVDVGVANVGGAAQEIEAELLRLVEDGVTEGELELAYRRLVQSWNKTRGTSSDAMDQAASAVEAGETLAAARARRVALGELTPDTVKAVAERWLHPDHPRVWVVVGDRAQLEPQLEELGWNPEWLTPQQAILGNF